MKKFFFLLIAVSLFSCNSFYRDNELSGTTKILVLHFDNYYEKTPSSEIIINNKKSIKSLLRLLSLLPNKEVRNKEFHVFNTKKSILKFYTSESVINITVVDNRVSFSDYNYIKYNSLWEKLLVKKISNL